VQPLLPGIREQQRTEHPVGLLFDQVDKGLKDLLQGRAARDALEYPALAFEQGDTKAHACGISRGFSNVEAHFQRLNEGLISLLVFASLLRDEVSRFLAVGAPVSNSLVSDCLMQC